MKKLLLILGIFTLLVLTGCEKDNKEEVIEDVTSVIEILKEESNSLILEVSETQQKELAKNFTETDDYMQSILSSKEIIEKGNSESLKKVLKAVELFQDMDINLGKMGIESLSVKDVKNIKKAVKKINRDIITLSEDEESDITMEEYQAIIKTEIIPKLDEAVKLLDEAVKLNEKTVIMTYENGGMNVVIEPAHILLIESILKTTRGVLYYIAGYDFSLIVESNGEEFEINKNFLRVTNREYIKKSKMDINDGITEMSEAVSKLPVSDMWKYNKETMEFEINESIDYEKIENILSIEAETKKEAETFLNQIKNALKGTAVVKIKGAEIKFNLSILFKDSFEIRKIWDKFSELSPDEEETIETWNQEPLANYTFEGIIPEGFKNFMNKQEENGWNMFLDRIFYEWEEDYEDEEEDEYSEFEEIFGNIKKVKNKK